MALYTQSWNDYDEEVGSQTFNVTDLTSANFDAQGTLQTAYAVAASNMSLGVIRQTSVASKSPINRALPTDPAAQREIKWLVTMLDSVNGKLFQTEVPCADTQYLQNNSSYVIYRGNVVGLDTDSNITDYKNGIEAYYLTPYGNTATVWDMELVGRNL